MAKQNKTVETKDSVAKFTATIKDEQKRKDFSALTKLISTRSGFKPKMWGNAIVGCGSYHYKYESGREGDAPLIAISPRAAAITIYLAGTKEKPELLKKLGKHKLSGGCLHVKALEDIDTATLVKLVDNSIKLTKKKYPG
jgi:hypothetical protein